MDDIDNKSGETGQQLRDTRGRLLKGHERIPGSGRPPGKKNWSVRALAEQLNVNPFMISLEILKTQHLPTIEPGKKGRLVSTGEYIKVLIDIQSFLAAKLAATQLTGANDGPVAVATCDITQLMMDPELAHAAQSVALALAQQQRPQIEARDDPDSLDDYPGSGVGVRR